MEMISQLLENNVVAQVLMILFIANAILASISVGLEKIKDLTESNLDNSIYAIVNKISSILQSILDFIGYNPKHKK